MGLNLVVTMETFSTLVALCEGKPPVTCGFPSQRPVMQNFNVFFDLHLIKRVSKSRRWRSETPPCSLWHQCNAQCLQYPGSALSMHNTDYTNLYVFSLVSISLFWIYSWCHQMETFSELLALCAGSRWIPRTKASDAELWCFISSASE